ncbi:uncharacterized protein A4U43_C09F230 [Asparagus officinalis]|uniref:Pentatricopeptide repeat-containing protein n=1 Tax=Asparagus officinalis TaxID=4686 RepID=A0A5P1E4D0_ASPOF|nr:uncharacterized protein A4U43_C09F230 [Asparagus officinalis]
MPPSLLSLSPPSLPNLPHHHHYKKPRTQQQVRPINSISLLRYYVQNGRMQDAHKLFDETPERTPTSWTILMDGYAQHGPAVESRSLLCDMMIELSFVNLRPDPFVVSVGLKACASFGSLHCGKELHCLAVKLGYMQDLFVANALVKVYSTCGCLRYAESVFEKISQPDLISWSSILSGLVKNGHEADALRLFVEMARTGIHFDSYVFSIGLKAFADQNCIDLGVQVHCHMIKMGMYSSFLLNSLVEFYGRIGELASMRKVFDNMLKKDLVSWNIVISCHAQSTCCEEALIYFSTLMHEGTSECDDYTLGSILQAVTRIGSTHHGKQIHGESLTDSGKFLAFNAIWEAYPSAERDR